MTGKTRSALLSFAVIAVLLFGAMSPTAAYADDNPPPDAPPTEVSSACTANGECPSSSEEATPEATDTPNEAPAEAGGEGNSSGEENPAPHTEETAPITEAVNPAPDSSILDEIPDDTTLVVLDEAGQSQSLATQAAVDAIVENDPIWCPQGQDPTPGANGCTPSFNSVRALLKFMSGNANYQGAGTIYIQEGVYVSGGQNDFNSPDYDLSSIRNFDLTVTGGWNPTTNVVDPASTSQFRIPFLIGTSTNPWGGSITISNITIDKSDGSSLVLYSQKDITLSNVNITNAHNNGAGAELNAGGNVNINNSNFIRNKKAGAIIKATGNVAIADSSFSNPTTGRQQITGVDIVSGGSVALANMAVNGNREVGANINAVGQVVIADSFFSGTKAIKRTGSSREFLGYGLQVVTLDNVLIARVTANDNFLWGASLDAGGPVTIADSIFNANTTESPGFIDDTGLLITSGSNVTITNIQANDNRLIGATIQAVGDVNIDNSTFNNNRGVTRSAGAQPTFHGYGLQVITAGGILLNLVDASNNMLFGAHLDAGRDVFVSSSTFNNQTSGSTTDQTGRGLEIISAGNVFLSNVMIDNNQLFGADIQAGGNVFLNSVTATDNGLNGLSVQGNCTMVLLGDGTYSNNGQYGLSVTDALLISSGSAVFANNGAGDLHEDAGACAFDNPNNATPPPASNPTSAGPAITFISPARAAFQQETNPNNGTNGAPIAGASFESITFDSFLANLRAVHGRNTGIFTGQYAYVYSASGVLQIVAL